MTVQLISANGIQQQQLDKLADVFGFISRIEEQSDSIFVSFPDSGKDFLIHKSGVITGYLEDYGLNLSVLKNFVILIDDLEINLI